MCFNLHVFQPPQDVFASYNEMDIIHIINALCWSHSLVFLLSFISEQLPSGLHFLLPEECLLLRLCQLVSENVYFILQHLLMLKEALQGDWSQESRGHQTVGTHIPYVKWPGAVGLLCLVFLGCRCSCRDATPVKTVFSAGCSLGLFRLCFVWVVFTLMGPCVIWSYSSCLEFVWLLASPLRWCSGSILCSPSAAPVTSAYLVAATPLLFFWTFFPVILSL